LKRGGRTPIPKMDPVLIIGGGVAGCTCAKVLHDLRIPVIVVDRARGPRATWWEIVSPRSKRALRAAGLPLGSDFGYPISSLHSAFGTSDLEGREYAFWDMEPGNIVDRSSVDTWLRNKIDEVGIDVRMGTEVVRVEKAAEGWHVALQSLEWRKTIRISFVLEATGSMSHSPCTPGVGRIYADQLVCLAVVGTYRKDCGIPAVVETCAEGWWFGAKLSDGNAVVTLFTDADLLGSRALRCDLVRSSFSATLHLRDFASLPAAFYPRVVAARSSARTRLWDPHGWMAIGDAAWTIDPLSGSGIGKAASHASRAAHCLKERLFENDLECCARLAAEEEHAYVQARAVQTSYYSREKRWRDSPFWCRRAGKDSLRGLVDNRRASGVR
jgi:flavin-dependent dehydrogenase